MTRNELEEKLLQLSPEQLSAAGAFVESMVELGETGKDWITVKTASEFLGVSKMSIRRKIEEGIIRTRRLGERKTLVALADIQSLRKAQLGI